MKVEDVYKEIFVTLTYFDADLLNKVPDRVISTLREISADSQKEVYIDSKKSLVEQDISEEAKDFIALIYYSYIADENEKKDINKIWFMNK